ncbi:hypothetical protein Tco_0866314 [Tanacetum coccineum]
MPVAFLDDVVLDDHTTLSVLFMRTRFPRLTILNMLDDTLRITAQETWFREVPLRKSKDFMPTFPAHHAHDSSSILLVIDVGEGLPDEALKAFVIKCYYERPTKSRETMVTVAASDVVPESSVREELCESSEIAIAYSSVSTPISGLLLTELLPWPLNDICYLLKLRCCSSSNHGHDKLLAEVGILGPLAHSNIITLLGYSSHQHEYLSVGFMCTPGSISSQFNVKGRTKRP